MDSSAEAFPTYCGRSTRAERGRNAGDAGDAVEENWARRPVTRDADGGSGGGGGGPSLPASADPGTARRGRTGVDEEPRSGELEGW